MLPPRIQPFVDLGYVCIAAEYRFVGEAKCPAQIEDVKACVRWTRGNAGTLGVEPDRIVNGGSSAGAHLALLAAGTGSGTFSDATGSDGIAACLAYYRHPELATGCAYWADLFLERHLINPMTYPPFVS